jgi:hypothetical protein
MGIIDLENVSSKILLVYECVYIGEPNWIFSCLTREYLFQRDFGVHDIFHVYLFGGIWVLFAQHHLQKSTTLCQSVRSTPLNITFMFIISNQRNYGALWRLFDKIILWSQPTTFASLDYFYGGCCHTRDSPNFAFTGVSFTITATHRFAFFAKTLRTLTVRLEIITNHTRGVMITFLCFTGV